MSPRALRRLALAAFLMFGVIGPLSILMESTIRLVPWGFVVRQILGTGGMAAAIVLFGRRRWWAMVLIITTGIFLLLLNSGAFSFIVDDTGMRFALSGPRPSSSSRRPDATRTLTPEELEALYTQRSALGIIAMGLLIGGYVTFIRTMAGEARQRARLETEVRIAHDIQESLLPAASLRNGRIALAGTTIPAAEVGGDFYDVVELPGGRVAVAVADVAGHGVGAGILSAMTKSALRSQLRHDPAPEALLANLNAVVYDLSDEKMFVTFAYLLFDPAGGSVRVATAGHPPILYREAGTVKELRTAGLGLGIRSDVSFTSVELTPARRSVFLLYTDGVIEAAPAEGEEFGADALRAFVAQAQGTPEEVTAALTRRLAEHAGTLQDDVTAVAVEIV